ncbi:hypothetical protein FHU41_000950 [Psychromicrobium silvestre]|uniref:Molybdenum cofactor biosynthesis protein F n=1 Tax=Psychromicrobium silvestre TaxID=1645614 RepID=A0A7Y9S536_9MICC|nr:MoaF C-terminal domain-containing protein [Psychromicrobium silvestre]NYE94729.1 hypothetical protein [Psychromicrobium silvestre]
MQDEEWKSYEEFADGIDTFRLANADLSGSRLDVELDSTGSVEIDFLDASRARWKASLGGNSYQAEAGDYDAVEVRSGVLFVNLPLGLSSVTLVFSRNTGRVIVTESRIGERQEAGVPRVLQSFHAAQLRGVEISGAAPEPSRDLIGQRNVYRYSPSHLYEHVYISSQRYAWQCLEGVQRGHGDMDLSTVWKLEEGLYLFCFREFRIPVASVWLHDLGYQLRTTGVFLGLNVEGGAEHSRGGGHIYPLGSVRYPDAQPV